MSKIDDGGLVYPGRRTELLELVEGGEEVHTVNYSGITLREWLAGLAMQGLLASGERRRIIEEHAHMQGKRDDLRVTDILPAYACQMADAMIAKSKEES